jgi:hypothetical protein|tara:strand:- start:405 stop:1061 length:657 start_codon:yes stop_codon:yes gene_type:complete
MFFPALCLDNFFNDPQEVVKIAKNVEYQKVNKIPGYRSKPIHEIDNNFFRAITLKMLSVYFPNSYRDINYSAYSVFQKTSSGTIDGWVHYDNSFFTSIIYLTDSDVGTSIYHQKNIGYIENLVGGKFDYFENYENYDSNELEKIKTSRDSVNSNFDETINFKGRYNRCVQFDGRNYHAAHQQDEVIEGEERLILITFFNGLIQNRNTNTFPTVAYPWI